jgi:predicted nucleotidyltransferase component of viral defense system
MIPSQNLVAWSQVVPWSEQRQVEQDLILCRAIIAIFGDPFLREQLRFRGGTALHKLHFTAPLRYSEDLDFVRTTAGPIKQLLQRLRAVTEPWLGPASYDRSITAPKLRFAVPAEDGGPPIRIKIEINTREIEAYDEPQNLSIRVDNPWFSGTATVPTFSREELLATKLRALLQRDKGRDLFDLAEALDRFQGLNRTRVVGIMGRCLSLSQTAIPRAEAERRMFAKLRNQALLTDLRPLLPAGEASRLTEESTREAFRKVFSRLIELLPGAPWAKTGEMLQRFNLGQPEPSGAVNPLNPSG